MKCPRCGHKIILFKVKYCPECGAKMDEPDIPKDDLLFSDDDTDDLSEFTPFADDVEEPGTDGDTPVTDEDENEPGDDRFDFDDGFEDEPREETLSEKANDIRLKMGIIGGACVVVVAFIILLVLLIGNPGSKETAAHSDSVPTGTQNEGDKVTLAMAEIEDIRAKYFSGNMSFEDAEKKLHEFYSDEEIKSYAEAAYNEILAEKDYRSSMTLAESLFSAGDFKAAISAYREALDKKDSSDEATEGLSKSIDAFVAEVSGKADAAKQENDYDTALALIGEALEFLPDNENLALMKEQTETEKTEYLKKLHEEEMQRIVAEAQRMVEKKKWDDALDYIKQALKDNPDDEILMKEYDYIKANMPMHLANVDMYDASGVRRSTHSTEDKNGKSYSNYVRFAATDNASAKFKLNGAYTEFTATLFIPDGAKAGKSIAVYFYVDDKVVQVYTGISENYDPIKVRFPVSGGKVLEIVTKNDGTSGGGFLMVAGSNFKRK